MYIAMDVKIISFILVVFISFLTVQSRVLDQGIRQKRSLTKYNDLKSKLTKLQDLLSDIEGSDQKHLKDTEKNIEEASKDEDESLEQLSKERKSTAKESAMSTANTKEAPASDKVKTVPDRLTEEDYDILKKLKESLEKASMTQKEQLTKETKDEKEVSEPKDKFYDSPLSDEELKEQKLEKLKQLAALALLNKQDHLNDGDGRSHTYARSEEGEFGSFRQELLENIEDKLLADISVAMRDGFSLDDLLQGLQKRGERRQERQKYLLAKRLEDLLRKEHV